MFIWIDKGKYITAKNKKLICFFFIIAYMTNTVRKNVSYTRRTGQISLYKDFLPKYQKEHTE